MNAKLEELARRLCVANGGGPESVPERHLPPTRPCVFHIGLAQRYWGLLADVNGREALRVLDEYERETQP